MNTKKFDVYKAALDYHSIGRPGKIEVITSKPCMTERDLSLAYTPGVAEPVRAIHKNAEDAYRYTAKGNLVAVVSNGTAILGLGHLGALASKPVMEGKGNLFKRFADVDVFDIELNTTNPDEIIKCCQLLEPTFGGINLEDIKAPECFYIEKVLKETMGIPVFHDDQHGTAIISGAALLNVLELYDKDISKVKVVFNGAGASAIASASLYVSLGVKRENITMCDTKGVIYEGRSDLNEYKAKFAGHTKSRTLADAVQGADVLVGLSAKGAFTKEMIASMAKNPIVFAMANPDPEIPYDEAKSVRKDLIMATGRSDYPNQVNNVLGFPFIFRGALDVRATAINDEMKLAASRALAKLAHEEVPEYVCRAYGGQRFKFGPEYIIPKPFDSRVLLWVAPAVAKAAMETGVAKQQIDLEQYVSQLERRLGVKQAFVRSLKDSIHRTEREAKHLVKVAVPEGHCDRMLRAWDYLYGEEIAEPILIGDRRRIQEQIQALGLENVREAKVVDPWEAKEDRERYAEELWKLRQRKGLARERASILLQNSHYFGAMMVLDGKVDTYLSGTTQPYPDTIRPLLRTIGPKPGHKVAGVYMMLFKNQVYFFADTTVTVEPTIEDLADIAIATAEQAKFFDIEPKIAMLSFSNFGSTKHALAAKAATAARLVKERCPELAVDGEMQGDVAVTPDIVERDFPFCSIRGGANVLIFPDLQSANIAYKLVHRLGGAQAIGPILTNMNLPVNVVQRTAEVEEIIDMALVTVMQYQKCNKAQNKLFGLR